MHRFTEHEQPHCYVLASKSLQVSQKPLASRKSTQPMLNRLRRKQWQKFRYTTTTCSQVTNKTISIIDQFALQKNTHFFFQNYFGMVTSWMKVVVLVIFLIKCFCQIQNFIALQKQIHEITCTLLTWYYALHYMVLYRAIKIVLQDRIIQNYHGKQATQNRTYTRILYMCTYENNAHVENVEHRILKTLTFPVKNYRMLYKPSGAAFSSNTRLGAGFLTFIEGKLLRKADISSIESYSE